MTNLFIEIFRFLAGGLTWKKVVFIIGIFIFIGLLLYGFELYTSSNQFSRLRSEADLLATINKIEPHGINGNPALLKAKRLLEARIVEAIDEKRVSLIPSNLKFSTDGILKFLCGAAIFWGVAAVVMVRQKLKKLIDPDDRNAPIMLLVLGTFTGAMALAIPNAGWPWVHLFVPPMIIISALLLGGFIAVITGVAKMTRTKDTPKA